MSHAHDLKDKPDQSVEEAIAAVEEGSASSESQSRIDLVQEDGSILTVTSFQGSPAELTTTDATPADVPDPEPPIVEVPRISGSAPPFGVGDDGVLRDESGQEVTDGDTAS